MKPFYKTLNVAILILTVIFVQLFSCKKYLDEKPDKGIVVPRTLTDLQALLDNSTQMNVVATPNFGESSADDYFLTPNSYNSFPSDYKNIYTWKRGDYFFQNDWSFAYTAIYNSNYCLEILRTIPVTSANQTQWNNVKGSALFYRSYYFLNLMWVYAKAFDESSANSDLGIVLRLASDFNIPSVRSSVKDCYQRIIQDGIDAISYLPDYSIHVMRPSKVAAYGLLARAYLSMRAYDSAFKYSNLCLHLKSDLINFNGDADINGSISNNTPFMKYNKETIFYAEMNKTYYVILPGSRAKIDTTLYASYASNDRRKPAFFKLINPYYQFKGSYAASPTTLFSGIATDEMFLTRAECYARLNYKDSALIDLNTLLGRRYDATFVPVTAATAQDALNYILIERRKELCMRGLRWIDIKRLNKEGKNIVLTRVAGGQTYTLQPNSNYYALPLPRDIIQESGIPQN